MHNVDIPLSKNLENSLKVARRHYLNVFYMESLFKLTVIIISSYLFFYISDRLWETPIVLRAILAITTWYFVIKIGANVLRVRSVFKKNYLPIVKVLQEHFKDLGDSLQSATELAYGQHRPSNISEDLCRAAIAQVDKKVSAYKLVNGISLVNLLRFFCLLLFMTVCFAGLFELEEKAFTTSLERWGNPFSATKRYLFTQFDLETKELIVVKGEESKFYLNVSKLSYFKPDYFNYKLRSSWKKENFMVGETNDTLYKSLILPPLTKDVDLKIKKGDYKEVIKIIPKDRPQLLDIKVNIAYPDYLGIEQSQKALYSQRVSVFPDTKISFIGKINKKIKSFRWQKNGQKILEKVKLKGNIFETPFLLFNEGDKLTFSWKDEDDFDAGKIYEYTIIFDDDLSPVITLKGVNSNKSLLPQDIIEINILGKDDFGLKEIGYEWIAKDKDGIEVKRFEQSLKKGNQQQQNLVADIIFSPSIEEIPEASNVAIRAYALDYQPYAEKIYTSEYEIYVLSLEEHLELVEEKFQKILQRVKSLVQSEQNNIQRTEAVEIYNDKKLLLKDVDQELLRIAQFEGDNYQTIKGLVTRGKGVIKEALQNELFRDEIILSWRQVFATLNQLADNEMTKARKFLKKSATLRKIEQRRNNIADGKEYQEEVLRALEDLSGKYADINRDSAINTFAVRLRNDSKREKKISENLKKLFIKTAGISLDLLSPEEKKVHSRILDEQKKVNADISSIEQELFTLYNQSKIVIYKEVYEKMIGSDVNNYLEIILDDISKNKTRSSISPAKQWSERFDTWADLFVPKEEENKEDEEVAEEEDEQEEENEEADNDLIVVIQRLADEEEKIYKITKNLTKWKRNQRYEKKLKLVKTRQKRNAKKTIEGSEMKGIEPGVKDALGNVNILMGEAYKELEEKGAGQGALNYEASSLELLLALIQEEEGGDGSGDGKSGNGKPSKGKGGSKGDGSEGGDSSEGGGGRR